MGALKWIALAGGLALIATAASSSGTTGPSHVVSLKPGRRYRVSGTISPKLSDKDIEGLKLGLIYGGMRNVTTDGEHFSFEGSPVEARDVTVNAPLLLPPPFDSWHVVFTSIDDVGAFISGDQAPATPSPLSGFLRQVLGF